MSTTITRTIRIWVKATPTLDRMAYLCKNVYNVGNYLIKKELERSEKEEGKRNWVRARGDLGRYFRFTREVNYYRLPAHTSENVLLILDRNWKSFFNALKDWKKNPSKYEERPEPPKFLRKNGRFIIPFQNGQVKIKDGFLHFPKKNCGIEPVKLPVKNLDLREVRIIPRYKKYIVEVVYNKEIEVKAVKSNNIIGIDIGVNNLVTIVNNFGKQPLVINGRVLKSFNRYYNKRSAFLQSIYDTTNGKRVGSKKRRLIDRRYRKMLDSLHKITRFIIRYCEQHKVSNIVIGYNKKWKQEVKLGKKTNQNFVQIPFYKLVSQLEYKAKEAGINVIKVCEAYTSKCSFLDNEPLQKHKRYIGKRIKRGLFRSSTGVIINADVNAGYNIIKKVFPNALSVEGIEGMMLYPKRCQIS